MKIDFLAETHIYTVDGKIVPSVTQIITGLGMVDFGAVPKHDLIKGRNRGREVHAIAESFDKGKLIIESIDPELVGYFKGWLKFIKDYSPVWKEIEMRGYNRLGYCFTLDRVGLIDGKTILLDLKTSEMKVASHTIQTALYQKGYEEFTGNKIKGRWVLHLSKEGVYKVEEHKDINDYFHATAAVMIYNWKVKNKMDYDIKANLEMYNF